MHQAHLVNSNVVEVYFTKVEQVSTKVIKYEVLHHRPSLFH